MQDNQAYQYVKRKQSDYPLPLKLEIIQEIERGNLSTRGVMIKYGVQSRATIIAWLRKYGNFNWEKSNSLIYAETPRAKIALVGIKN